MRPLDESKTTQVLEKMFKFSGNNLKNIVDRPCLEGSDTNPVVVSASVCRRTECSTVSESLVKRATNVKRDKLVSLLNPDRKVDKKWQLSSHHTSEMSFLYGDHVLKGGLGRITESIVPGDGVVVLSMADMPLGFGVAAKSTQDCRKMDPNGIVVLHQADVGEYDL